MSIKQKLKKAMVDFIRTGVEIVQRDTRSAQNVDLALTAMLRDDSDAAPINDIVAYVELLRTCIAPLARSVVSISKIDDTDDVESRRFVALLDMLGSQIPPIPSPVAIDIARRADRFSSLRTPFDFRQWSGDAGLLFQISSSFGVKGRILASIIRVCRPNRCLELGTAFGMSAMFMMESFKQMELPGGLVTVEGNETLYSIASRELKDRYGDKVDCQFGMTGDVLPKLAKTVGPIDFMFHDAGHTGDAYVDDFHAIVDALAPGAVILFDDIRWEDARFLSRPAQTYRGWRQVAAHSRVRHAVEVDKAMGLALLR
jgi:predicted O-methyltransferase YrrM